MERQREPLWRMLGAPVAPNSSISVEDALRDLALDPAGPNRLRLYFRTEDEHGSPIWHGTNKYALVTKADDMVVGYIDEPRDADSPATLGRYIDTYLRDYRLDTVGVVSERNLVFVAIRGQDRRVHDDVIQTYYLITQWSGTTRQRGILVRYAPVHELCQTVLNVGDFQKLVKGEGETFDLVEQKLSVLPAMAKVESLVIASFEKLAVKSVDKHAFGKLLSLAYPLPTNMNGRRPTFERARMLDRRRHAEALLDAGHVHPRHTAWAAYNAIVECEDYYAPRIALTQSSAVEILWGRRTTLKERVFLACLKLL